MRCEIDSVIKSNDLIERRKKKVFSAHTKIFIEIICLNNNTHRFKLKKILLYIIISMFKINLIVYLAE